MSAGTKYCIVLEYSGGDGSNYIKWAGDVSSPTHGGNVAYYTSSWSASSGVDRIFYVNGTLGETVNVGDVILGDDATGSYAHWDNSLGTFSVYADNVPERTIGTFGGDGSDGALSASSGTTTLDASGARVLVKNYTSISLTGTAKITISNPHANGTILILKSQGNVTMTSSATVIDMAGMGASGGVGPDGGSGVGTVGKAGTALGRTETNFGNGGSSTTGGVSSAAHAEFYTLQGYHLHRHIKAIACGNGGGSGAGSTAGTGAENTYGAAGDGGRGGGGLIIECAGAYNFTTGTISVSGSDGEAGPDTANDIGGGVYSGGGGGGGSSGMILVLYETLTANSGTYLAAGGAGGKGGDAAISGSTSGTGFGGGGGGGGGGYSAGGPAAGNGASGTASGSSGTTGGTGSGGSGGGGAGCNGGVNGPSTGGAGGAAGATDGAVTLVAVNKFFA